jgi:hypothetical protein
MMLSTLIFVKVQCTKLYYNKLCCKTVENEFTSTIFLVHHGCAAED